MFGQRETISMQRTIPLLIGTIGLACCVLALLDMRSLQTNDRPPAQPNVDTMAAHQLPHHMRGWQAHKSGPNAAPQRVELTDEGPRRIGKA